MHVRTILIVFAALAASCKHVESSASPLVPQSEPTGLAVFTRPAMVTAAKLSPKGTFVAALSEEGGKRTLSFIRLATRQITFLFRPEGDSTIGDFYWANDERVVIEMVDYESYLAAPVSRGEIYAVDATGTSGRVIFGYRAGEQQVGSHIRKAATERAWGFVIGPLRKDPRKVLIQQTYMDDVGDRVPEVHKLDVYTGLKTFVARSPLRNAEFLTDENGELRIAAASDENANERYFYFEGSAGWRELRSIGGLSSQSTPIGFVASERALYVSEPAAEGFALYLVSIDTGERKLVSKSETSPISDAVQDNSNGRIVAVEYEPDLPTYEYLDAAHPLSRILQGLLVTNPNEHVRIVSTTDDDRKALVRVYSDRDPGRYLLADVATMTAETIADVRPWVKPDSMAEMSAFHIPASDGFRIHGYITMPPNAQPGTPPPLVVLPHGGPHSVRNQWRFDPEAQLLAHEGFAVLQVNYRGSGGYGLAYEKAGYRKWGDRVVQDIIDATRFAVRKGFGDPKRICIYGASFGGYAAIQSSVLAPDLFRCAAGYSGIYDLNLLTRIGDISLRRLGRGYVRTVVGEDSEALAKASPVKHADLIAARVFLIHGSKDERAPIRHAESLRDALTARGNAPEWLVESKEGHGFFDDSARERMYGRLVKFLQENTRPGTSASSPR